VAKERLKSPRARLFVALDLPDEVREGLVEWQETFDDPSLRVVRPESLHMTLVFLGYQAEKDIERIADAALGVDAPAPEIQLAPDPIGVPRGKRPRLFAVDAQSEGAIELQRRVEERLVKGRFYEPEKRPFWPHLTVARVRPEKRGPRKPTLVDNPPGALPERLFRPFTALRLTLYRSHLRPQGAEYIPLAEKDLKSADDTTER
jgi:RNA 2',3'-cyclic 3'-phosphodiesterase